MLPCIVTVYVSLLPRYYKPPEGQGMGFISLCSSNYKQFFLPNETLLLCIFHYHLVPLYLSPPSNPHIIVHFVDDCEKNVFLCIFCPK